MEIPGYEIKRLIGQGGMATAYLAEQRSLRRQVVLKILDASATEAPETVARFVNEGRIIASLNHPHIITIYDIGQAGDKVYISMEFVEGGDLKQRLIHKVFAPVEAIEVIEKVAAGLVAAHESGIVHRDVKPGNILFRRDGTPLLSDFGIAKRLSGDSDLTSTGMFVGSPNYMAPEQPESGPIDGRADIYSLGIILYEMLTGERAYAAESVIDVILMHKNAPIPKLPAGFEHYQELLNLMLAKDRHERFRDARSLIHFIEQMRRAGVIKSKAQMAASPDINVTGELEVPTLEAPVVTRVSLGRRKVSPGRWLILALLALCMLGWGALLMVERRLQAADAPRTVAATAPVKPAESAAPADSPQIAQALLWLGRHALDDFRLTDPPRDNAYYYFSRLQQLEPASTAAREGMLDIASRYAMLAEREIAQDHYDTARSYVGIGLQIDPTNDSLRVLQDIAAAPEIGFWDALASLFK